MVLVTIIVNSLQGILIIFPDEKPILLREQNGRLYTITA